MSTNDVDLNSSSSDDVFDRPNVVGIVIGLGCLVAPVVALTATVFYMLFSYLRINYRVFWQITALSAVAVFIASLFGYNAIDSFVSSYSYVPGIFDSFTLSNVAHTLGVVLLHQFPLSFVVGGAIGATYSWWRWFRRPEWKQYKFRLTPLQIVKKKRNIADIQNDRNTPPDGRTLGINMEGERVNQSEHEARAHTFVVGAAGSGKTTTILNGARDIIKRGEGLAFIDLKGNPGNAEALYEYAKRYNRNFYHWTSAESEQTYSGPAERPAYYSPLSRGDATRKTNLVIAGRETSGNASYYTNIAQNYIQKAFEVSNAVPGNKIIVEHEVEVFGAELEDLRIQHERDMEEYHRAKDRYDAWVEDGKPYIRNNKSVSREWDYSAHNGELDEPIMPAPFTGKKVVQSEERQELDAFMDLINLLDPAELKKRSLDLIGKSDYYQSIVNEIHALADRKMDNNTRSALESIRDQLGTLMYSVQGRWLKKDPNGDNNIDFFKAAHEGDVVVFSIDSSNYPANARILGDFIIQDLKTVSSELREDPSRFPLHIIIDEFSAIGSDNVMSLISKSRDAKMPVTLTTQSLGDLKAVSESFMEQLVGTISAFVIHRANAYGDAQLYSSLTDKIERKVLRESVSHTTNIFGMGRRHSNGKGSLDIVSEYAVTADKIQKLGTGEAYYICKDPKRLEHIQVYAEASSITSTERRQKTSEPRVEQPVFHPPVDKSSEYNIEHSENYKVSMEEQRKEEEKRVHDITSTRANRDSINRIMGNNISGISVKRTRPAIHEDVSETVTNDSVEDKPSIHIEKDVLSGSHTGSRRADDTDSHGSSLSFGNDHEDEGDTSNDRPESQGGLALPDFDIDDDYYQESSIPDIFGNDD